MSGPSADKSVFQALYDSEINFAVSCFWDGGFIVRLGDDMNGWSPEQRVDTWEEVGPALAAMAMEAFPTSGFARTWVRALG
jgi:hypothetical protein